MRTDGEGGHLFLVYPPVPGFGFRVSDVESQGRLKDRGGVEGVPKLLREVSDDPYP